MLRRARAAARRERGRLARPASGQPPWIAAWVPGHSTNALTARHRRAAAQGAKVVMQVHYNLIDASGPDRTRAELRIRPATTHLTRSQTHLIAAPVELPCPDGVTGPQCSRQQAFQDEVNKYGAENAFDPGGAAAASATRRSPTTRSRSARARRSARRATAPSRRPETIYGVAGHMHLRGHDISVALDPGTPKAADAAAHARVGLPLAGRLLPRASGQGRPRRHGARHVPFDNSKADQPVVGTKQLTPRYVLWGEGTTDEMCLAMLSVAGV